MPEPTLDKRIRTWLFEVYGRRAFDGEIEFNDRAVSALLTVVDLHAVRMAGVEPHGFVMCIECGGEREDPPYCDTLAGIAEALGIVLDGRETGETP